MRKTWKDFAERVHSVYGVELSLEENNEFFICPECDEPVYKIDYPEIMVNKVWCKCPICERDLDL